MIKNYIILLMVFLSGCGLKKQSIVFERQNINSSEMIIDKIKLKTVDANRLLLNAKIKLNDNNTSKINANIRIIKDSLIWISVKAGLGIEVFRTIITPDSVRYINHISKQYFIKPIHEIYKLIKMDITYYDLQDILFSNHRFDDETYNTIYQEYIVLESENARYFVNSHGFYVEKIEIIDNQKNRMFLEYDKFKKFNNGFFPQKLFLDIKSNEFLTAEINYVKIKFNENFKTKFNVPKSYTEAY